MALAAGKRNTLSASKAKTLVAGKGKTQAADTANTATASEAKTQAVGKDTDSKYTDTGSVVTAVTACLSASLQHQQTLSDDEITFSAPKIFLKPLFCYK